MELGFAPLKVLSEREVRQIQDGTANVLETTGIVVEDPEVIKFMESAGCKADYANNRVRIPQWLITECLDSSPSSYILKARDPEFDVHITSGRNTYFMASCGMGILDFATGQTRDATRKEFYDAIKVLDYLEHVDIQTAFPYWGFERVPQCMRLIESAASKFRVSRKVQEEGSSADEYRWITAMAKALNADVVQIANPVSPLTFFKSFTDRLRYLAENDMPMQFASGPTKGITSPVTVAGAIVSNNAETIASIVLAQLYKKGARSWAGSMMLTPNMLNGLPAFGDIGQGLHDAVFNQVWQAYQIPSTIWSSSWTSSLQLDYQAGYEISMMALINALCAASVIVSFSGFHAQLSAHPAKSIIDNDVVGMIKRFCAGSLVNKETLAIDLINKVGPMPNNFLNTKHTYKHWREECYIPAAANRFSGKVWEEKGSKHALDLALDKMDDILKTYSITPLTDSQEDEIEYILNDARNYYRKNGMISDAEWTEYQKDLNSPNYPYA